MKKENLRQTACTDALFSSLMYHLHDYFEHGFVPHCAIR